LPYGETWYETGTADKWKFTTYERDTATAETGLDYAGFRYYASTLGRFLSPDFRGGSARSPQGLCRYSYVLNDPINLVDPTGMEGCVIFLGINTPRDSTNSGSKDSLLQEYRLTGIYSYDGGRVAGVGQTVRQDFGPSSRTTSGAAALNEMSPDVILAWSGGAEIVSKAYNKGLIDESLWSNVQQKVWISPGTGLGTKLPLDPNDVIIHGNNGADFWATLSQRLKGNYGTGLPCNHGDLKCFLMFLNNLLLQHGCGKPFDLAGTFPDSIDIPPLPTVVVTDLPPDPGPAEDDCPDGDCGGNGPPQCEETPNGGCRPCLVDRGTGECIKAENKILSPALPVAVARLDVGRRSSACSVSLQPARR